MCFNCPVPCKYCLFFICLNHVKNACNLCTLKTAVATQLVLCALLHSLLAEWHLYMHAFTTMTCIFEVISEYQDKDTIFVYFKNQASPYPFLL